MKYLLIFFTLVLTSCKIVIHHIDHKDNKEQQTQNTQNVSEKSTINYLNRNEILNSKILTSYMPNDVDFKVINARAIIGSRDYVLDIRDKPIISKIAGNLYQLDLVMRRDSKVSLRGNERITTHFYYDGTELIFFGDKNHNYNFDRSESGKMYHIRYKQEVVLQDKKSFFQKSMLSINLQRQHINSNNKVKDLSFDIYFK